MIDFSQMVTAEAKNAERLSRLTAEVDGERDRRTAAGFVFGGVLFQARPKDIANINGAAMAATIAISAGAGAAGLRWSNPDEDFAWIAADDTLVPMEAYDVVRFGLAALAHVSGLIMAARRIKDRLLSGELLDIGAAELWP